MEEKIFISLTKSELQHLISDAVDSALKLMPKHDVVYNQTPELLNIKQVAELLNLSVQTIYGYTSNCGIPYFKKSKRLYFKRSKVMEWLESN